MADVLASEIAQPFSRDGLHQRVADTLRRQIAGGQLKPGERLLEMHIARQLGVSQAPVREALRLLEREGLVIHQPRRGVYVTQLSARVIDEVYSLRCVIEVLAVRRALLHMTVQELAALEQIVADMDVAAQGGDADGLVACCASFHEFICLCSRHQRLIGMWRSITAQMSHISAVAGHLYIRHLPAEYEHHYRVLDALRTGDPDLAEQAIKDHFRQAGHQFLRTALDRGLLYDEDRVSALRAPDSSDWSMFLEPETDPAPSPLAAIRRRDTHKQ